VNVYLVCPWPEHYLWAVVVTVAEAKIKEIGQLGRELEPERVKIRQR